MPNRDYGLITLYVSGGFITGALITVLYLMVNGVYLQSRFGAYAGDPFTNPEAFIEYVCDAIDEGANITYSEEFYTKNCTAS